VNPVAMAALIVGVLALLVREILAVRLDEPRGRTFGGAEGLVAVSLLLLAPRIVELLT
jgi:hypothetical protein